MKPVSRLIFLAFLASMLSLEGTMAQERSPAAATATPEQYLSTGRSVTLADGRSIHLVCMGSGSPTVILTAGQGDWSAIWRRVQPAIARRTRVCAWDRAGIGLSDASRAPQTVDNTTADLEQALERGGVTGPYVLVGHSLGSYESLRFADRHLRDVAGMILVDPSFPDQEARLARAAPAFSSFLEQFTQEGRRQIDQCVAGLQNGEIRVGSPDPNGCLRYSAYHPQILTAALAERDSADPARLETLLSLIESFDRSASLIVSPGRNYGDMPLIVLTATEAQSLPPNAPPAVQADVPRFFEEWRRGHNDLASLSARGVRRPVAGASHYIQDMRPDAVIGAINEVLSALAIPPRP